MNKNFNTKKEHVEMEMSTKIITLINFIAIVLVALFSTFMSTLWVACLLVISIVINILIVGDMAFSKKSSNKAPIIIFAITYVAYMMVFQLNLDMYVNFFMFKDEREQLAITATKSIRRYESEVSKLLYPYDLVVIRHNANMGLAYFRMEYETIIGVSNYDTPEILKQSGFVYTEEELSKDKKLPLNANYIKRIDENWYYIKYDRATIAKEPPYAKLDDIARY